MTYGTEDRWPRRVRSELNETWDADPKAPSVWCTKEWGELQIVITDALKPHAEAWAAVAKGLEEHHRKYAPRPSTPTTPDSL